MYLSHLKFNNSTIQVKNTGFKSLFSTLRVGCSLIFSFGWPMKTFRFHSTYASRNRPILSRPSKIHSSKSFELAVPLTTGKHNKNNYGRISNRNVIPEGMESVFLRLSGYGIGQSINISALPRRFSLRSTYSFVQLPDEIAHEVACLSTINMSHQDRQDIFIFKSGVVVFWNLPDNECHQMIRFIHPFCNTPVSSTQIELEELRYFYSENSTDLLGEDICLQFDLLKPPETDKPTTQTPPSVLQHLQNLQEKMAFSDALALSVKLSLLESSFDAVAVQIEPWIEKMQTGLGIFFPLSMVFRKTGELFTLRHLLNVSTSITETPDFYWDRPEIEKLFKKLKGALSVQARTKILNSKLDMCFELSEILTNHLQARHSSRLEWMIIALILIEVIFEFYHLYELNEMKKLETLNENSI